MNQSQSFISYKKLCIFGAKKSGKTSLTNFFEGLPFSECESDNGN